MYEIPRIYKSAQLGAEETPASSWYIIRHIPRVYRSGSVLPYQPPPPRVQYLCAPGRTSALAVLASLAFLNTTLDILDRALKILEVIPM